MHEVGHIGFDVYFSKLSETRISRKNYTHSLRFYLWFCVAVSVGLKAGDILYCLANLKSTF